MPLRVFAALLMLSPPASADIWTFATPSGNIECTVGEDFGGSDLECTIFQRSATMPQFAACPVKRGITVSMGNKGSVGLKCTATGKRPLGAQHVAEYGEERRFGGFSCLSAKTGLQCRNDTGHGFHLSRRKQSVF